MVDQVTAVGGPKLTPEELIARARELAAVFAERAAQTEELRRVPDENVRDLIDAGLIGVATPETYGGHGVDLDTMFEVGWRVAQGCGSTGWFYTVTQSHNWLMGHASEEAQEEYFSSPNVISSSAFAPTGKAEKAEDGSFSISGRWPFSSGVDHAEWVWLGAIDTELKRPAYLLVPRSDITILDDWFVAGLKGTGSKSVVIEESVFVPGHRALYPGPPSFEARERHRRASYGVPQSQVMPSFLATPLVGIAQGAVSIYTERTKNRVVRRGPQTVSAAEGAGSQFRVTESAAQADAAVAMLRADLRELVEIGARGEALSEIDRARFRRNHCYVAKLAVSAVNRLFEASGANALLDPSPLARMHRDVNAGSHQVALQWDEVAEIYGKVRFGIDPGPGMW